MTKKLLFHYLRDPFRLVSKWKLACVLLLVITQGYAQQTRVVSGVVTSYEEGEALPGVNIIVKNSDSRGTITNLEGKYSLTVFNEDTLVFSFVGFASEEIPVGNRTVLDVSLVPDLQSLTEVVVVGYGTQKKTTLTGSVSEIKGADIVASPQPNISNSLAGRFSGLIANNRGGEPGYDGSSYSIRGLATTGNNDVLVVVDGVPGQVGGLDRLDANDIESITVLKDASAAIYGSRAANGVILVTTKRGETGKPVISYSFEQGFSSPTRLPRMADAATYAQIRNEIEYYNTGSLNQVYSEEEIQRFRNGTDPLNYPNTDWANETLKKVALQNQHSLSVNGGTDRINYFLSLGMFYQDGLYKEGATKYKQYNFRSNIDADITDRLTVGLSLSGRQEDRQFPTEGAVHIFRTIYRAYPTAAAYYPNGLPSTGIEDSNPAIFSTAAGGLNVNPSYVFNGILRGSYDLPIKGFSVDGFYSVDRSFSNSKNFRTPYTLYDYNSVTQEFERVIVGGGPDQQASLEEEMSNQFMSVANIKLNYLQNFGHHNISAFVGYEQSEVNDQTMGASRWHFPTPETPEMSQGGSAAADYNNWGSSYHFTRKSYLGRLSYNYDEKYLLEVQTRVDGSSIFPKGERYGFFPSVSAGWRISEESWFENAVTFIDDLKIRASHGQLGNDNVGQFQFFDNYSFNNRYVIGDEVHSGIDLIKLSNPNITWEVATKTDIGLNARLFKNLSMEMIYFQQKRTDILEIRNASIPAITGIVNPYDDDDNDPLVPSENIGKVNSSGIEATLSYDREAGDFWYGVSGNFTYAKNELVFKDEAPAVLAHQRETGRPLNTYLLYDVIGIYRTEEDLDNYPAVPGAKLGDLIYEDYDGNGSITADDMVRSKYGNIPEITYGLSMKAGWKHIDLSILFAGQARVSQYVLPESGTVGNFYSSWADNRWSPTNPEGSYPRVSERASSAVSGGLYRNNFWLNDASFLRLKNVQIGYTLPPAILSRIKMADVRVYASAFNLFTLTKVKDYDPEGDNESGHFYPQQKIINLGINIKF